MLKTVDYQNGWRTYGYSSKFKRKLWSKSVVSVEQILRAQEAVREVYMDEKIENTYWYYFATRYPEKYKLADLKPLISFGASPRGSINWRMQNVMLLSNDVVM
jgi:hypothetical protein